MQESSLGECATVLQCVRCVQRFARATGMSLPLGLKPFLSRALARTIAADGEMAHASRRRIRS